MRKLVSIITLMLVLFACNALDVRHFKYLHKVQTEEQLVRFNHYYVGKVEPQLRMAKTVASNNELGDIIEVMRDYNVEFNKPFFLAYTAHGYIYTVFGLRVSRNSIRYYLYKEEILTN